MRSRAGGKGGRTRAWDGPGVCLCVLVFTAIVCTPLILALALFSSWHYSRLDYSSLYHSRLDSILVFTTAVWTNLVFTTLVLIQFLCLQLLSGLIFFLLLSSLPTFASLYSCLHEACSRRYFTLFVCSCPCCTLSSLPAGMGKPWAPEEEERLKALIGERGRVCLPDFEPPFPFPPSIPPSFPPSLSLSLPPPLEMPH